MKLNWNLSNAHSKAHFHGQFQLRAAAPRKRLERHPCCIALPSLPAASFQGCWAARMPSPGDHEWASVVPWLHHAEFTNHGCRSEANPGDLHRSRLNSHTMTPSWLHDHHELNLSSGSWETHSPNVRRRAEARLWRVCEIAQRLWKTWRLVVILSQSLFDPYYPALLVLVQMSNAEFLLLLHYLHFLWSQNVKSQLRFLFFIGSWMHWSLQILLVSMMFFAMILLAKSSCSRKVLASIFSVQFFSH